MRSRIVALFGMLAVAAMVLLGSSTPAVAQPQARPALAPMECPVGPAGDDCRKAEASPGPGTSAKPLPSPSKADDPCRLLRGPAKKYCEGEGGPSSGSNLAPSNPADALNPLQSLADGITAGAAWTVEKLSSAVAATSNADFTSAQFLKQYAIVFAASTILTLILWLVAVMKRAIRGVNLTRAFGEAVGLLWMAVVACAFTPLILYVVVGAVDAVTDVLTGEGSQSFFADYAQGIKNSKEVGGGPIVQIIIALVSMLAAGVLWLELVIRTAALYVGAVLGTVVYSGLVDRDLWKHVRRWAGLMGAIILTKPIIMIVLGLASGLSSTPSGKPDALSSVISGLAIIIMSIVGSVLIYRFIPGLGDDIVSSRRDLVASVSRRRQDVPASRPSSYGISQGISTHAQRQPTSSSPSGGMGGPGAGMSAHSSRPTGPPPQQGPQQTGNQGPTG